MERDRENLWTRRSKDTRPSLSMGDRDHGKDGGPASTRTFSSSKSSHGRTNPFNAMPPLNTQSPSAASATSSAFGLGQGAFASFGAATKTPKTPGSAFDFSKAASGTPTTPGGKSEGAKLRGGGGAFSTTRASSGEGGADDREHSTAALPSTAVQDTADAGSGSAAQALWPLKHTWVIWYRPPTSKSSDYEKSIQPICRMSSAQDFWKVYTHLKHPSTLPTVSDYHFFKQGIRPVWEDEQNKRGGKWIMRLKKGVADRYWEDLLMAMVGDQFMEASEEVCGMVLSVRSGEDVFSIWTKNDGGKNVRIRETIKRALSLPSDTNIIWKSHDDSIAQRSAIDEARQQGKTHHGNRRVTLSAEDSPTNRDKDRS